MAFGDKLRDRWRQHRDHGERPDGESSTSASALARSLSALQWRILAAGGAVLTALAGWLLVAALCSLGWLSVVDEDYGAVLRLASQGWLLAHWVPITLAGVRVSLAPLGYTALIALIGSGFAGLAGRRALRDDIDITPPARRRRALQVAALFAAVYTLVVVAVAVVVEGRPAALSAMLGGVFLGFISGLVGAARALHWNPWHTKRLGFWGALAPAVGTGLLVLFIGGAVVLMVGLLRHGEQFIRLHNSLSPGVGGGLMLLLGQLAWLPNLVAWAASWALGAGFSLGVDSIVTPVANQLGALPDIPILGAVPAPGPSPASALWWLTTGVLAGAMSAWVLTAAQCRSAAELEHDLPALESQCVVGGTAGIVTGLVFTGLQLLARGDTGVARLVGLGARLPELLVLAPTLLGISGLVAGLMFALQGGHRSVFASAAAPGAAP